MSTEVDLSQLTIERGDTDEANVRLPRHLLTRYVVPAAMIIAFLALVVWAAWDFVFPPRPVRVVPVLATRAATQLEGTPIFNAAGWIEPRPTPVRVAALTTGVVEQLLVVEDQPVKANQAIAEMIKDDARLACQRATAHENLREAELDQAKAILQAARTRLEQPVHIVSGLGEAEAALAKLKTQLKNLPFETRRSVAKLKFAQQDYEGKLAAKGAIAGRVIDEAKSALDTAKALVEELQHRNESLEKEQSALLKRRNALRVRLELLADEIKDKDEALANVKAANARVEQARVAVAEAKLRLDRMTVRAPIDGRVYQLIGHPGASVGSGMTQMEGHDGSTIVTMYQPEKLQIRVDVRFEDLPYVRLNQPVRIENPALSSFLSGDVLFISSVADIQKNTLEVKVAIHDPPSVFKPDMLVDVTFLAPKEAGQKSTEQLRLFLPTPLVRQDEGGSFVWLADQSAGVARRTPVQLGMTGTGGLVEITTGLDVSSRIIATGHDELRDADRIQVIGEDTSIAPSSVHNSVQDRVPHGDNN